MSSATLFFKVIDKPYLRVTDNPFECCSLAWLYRDGLVNGYEYQRMIQGADCTFGNLTESTDVWTLQCSDFYENCLNVPNGFDEQCQS